MKAKELMEYLQMFPDTAEIMLMDDLRGVPYPLTRVDYLEDCKADTAVVILDTW